MVDRFDVYVGIGEHSTADLVLHDRESGERYTLNPLAEKMLASLLKYRLVNEAADGATRIMQERGRQRVVEGWTPDHDDQYRSGELRRAAICYLHAARPGRMARLPSGKPSGWPWAAEWWKPSDDPVRNLEKAGALIAAELDRVQREQAAGGAQ